MIFGRGGATFFKLISKKKLFMKMKKKDFFAAESFVGNDPSESVSWEFFSITGNLSPRGRQSPASGVRRKVWLS